MNPGILGAVAGGASALPKMFKQFQNIGAPPKPSPAFGAPQSMPQGGLTGAMMGARNAAQFEQMNPLELRQHAQQSLIDPAPYFANAMQSGWQPTAGQALALPNSVRAPLKASGYNIPGMSDTIGPIAQRAFLGWLAGAGLAGSGGGSGGGRNKTEGSK